LGDVGIDRLAQLRPIARIQHQLDDEFGEVLQAAV
jgi:hypothetical protein